MCDEETKELLKGILQAVSGEHYEPGGIFTIGGIAGTYMLKSPFNTECEYKLVDATCSGTSSPFALTLGNPSQTFPTIASASFGATINGSEGGNQLEGIAGIVGNGGVLTTQEWLPLGKGVILYLAVNPPASQSILLNIAFRRKYLHLIPDIPTMHPATHTHPQSRRALRMLHALSAQVSGYEQQYPTRLGVYGEQFQHEEIPETQDPSQAMTTYKARSRRYGR